MMQCPYVKGDSITLEHEYEISNLLSEAQNYWLFDGVQKLTNKKVQIKVYNNEGFSSIFSAENAWISEVNSLQSEAEQPGLPGKYLESGVIEDSGEKVFIIIFDLEIPTEKEVDDEIDLDKAEEEKQSFGQPVGAVFEKLQDLRDEREIPQPPVVESMDLDSFDEVEESIEDEVGLEPELTEEPIEDEIAPDTIELEVMKEAERIVKAEVTEELKEVEEIEDLLAPTLAGAPGFAPTAPKRKKAAFKDTKKVEMREEIVEEEKDYLKHISMEYFDRMNPQNYYPMTINITDIIKERMTPVVNPITGERKIQKQSEMDVTLKDPIITVRPTIPGCSVVPRDIDTDFTQTEDELTFFVTPGVKGKILGHIKFINEGKEIHTIDLEAKVVDPRFARVVAYFGILASFVPKIISILGINLGLNSTLNELWSVTEATFGGMSIASLIALGGIIPVILVSLGVRQILKPKSTRVQFKLADFRLKDIKPVKTL